MLKKFGVNNTRVEKRVAGYKRHKMVVTCASCGRKFEKECPSEELCKIASKCPKCGGKLEA